MTFPRLSSRHDTPGADLVVSVTSEQSLAIGAPGEGDTLGLTALLALLDVLGLELVNLALLLEVEDGDAGRGGSAQPVAVGRENESVDLVTGLEGVEVLGLVKVPEHGGTVLTTGGAEGSIGRDSDGVDIAAVADVVGLETARGELPNLRICKLVFGPQMGNFGKLCFISKIDQGNMVMVCLMAPKGSEVANTYMQKHHFTWRQNTVSVKMTYLNELVPSSRDDDGVLGVGAESDARHPLGVALVGDGELAVTKGVPELDRSVARAGNNLAVVGGEGD
jgi:hypothetical protein